MDMSKNKGPSGCPMGYGKQISLQEGAGNGCPVDHSSFLMNPAEVSSQILAVRKVRKALGLPDRKDELKKSILWFADDSNLSGSVEEIEAVWEPKFRASALSAYWMPELKAFITKAHRTNNLISQDSGFHMYNESMNETDPIISLLNLKESIEKEFSVAVKKWHREKFSSVQQTELDQKRLLLHDRALREYWQGKVVEVDDDRLGSGDLGCLDFQVGISTFISALIGLLSSEIMTISDQENRLTVDMIRNMLEKSLDEVYATLFDFTGFSKIRDSLVVSLLNSENGEVTLEKEFRTRIFEKLEGNEAEVYESVNHNDLDAYKINEETGCPMRFLYNSETKTPILIDFYKEVLIPLIINLWAKPRYED